MSTGSGTEMVRHDPKRAGTSNDPKRYGWGPLRDHFGTISLGGSRDSNPRSTPRFRQSLTITPLRQTNVETSTLHALVARASHSSKTHVQSILGHSHPGPCAPRACQYCMPWSCRVTQRVTANISCPHRDTSQSSCLTRAPRSPMTQPFHCWWHRLKLAAQQFHTRI